MKKTVLLCCNSVFGMVNFRGGVIRHLISAGHRVVVAAPHDAYVDELLALGVDYEEWRLSARSTGLLAEALAILRLDRLIAQVRPDIIFNYTVKAVIYSALVARRRGVPFVSVITGLGYAFINKNWVGAAAVLLYRRTLKWSSEVWLLNAEDERTMRERGLLDGVKTRLLPGEGVNTTYFAPAAQQAVAAQPQFLLIARLLRDKGILEFVEAARLLHARHLEVRLTLLGAADADNPTALTRHDVAQWEREGLVEYLGVAKDVRPFIRAADCVVLPSYREGLPRTLLEASAMGRPVIATDVPGCRDAVVDGVTGVLCLPKNAADLAAKMERMMSDGPDRRAALGANGRQFVLDTFDERLIFIYYDRVLDACTGRSQPL